MRLGGGVGGQGGVQAPGGELAMVGTVDDTALKSPAGSIAAESPASGPLLAEAAPGM
jgi:hypothetical protein